MCFPNSTRRAATPSGQWYRAYGNENWEFDAKGYMRKRIASINEAPIDESERRISVPEAGLYKLNAVDP